MNYLDLSILLLVDLEDPVHYGYVPPLDLEDDDLPDPDVLLLVVGQKQQVAPLNKYKVS